MELPYHLKTLPPEALDALRFFATIEHNVASAEDICVALDLSDRGFGKLIRRLVTKGYVTMDGSQLYRLTLSGQEAAEELLAWDETAPAQSAGRSYGDIEDTLTRRLVLVAPRTLVPGQPAQVYLGFRHDVAFFDTVDLVARLSVVNGEPQRPQEAQFRLGSAPQHHTFEVTAAAPPIVRLRVEVFQLGPDIDDFAVCGGMYVDLDADTASADTTLAAFGVDLTIKRQD